MKRIVYIFCLLLLLAGCVEQAPLRPVMRFDDTPVTLTQGELVLRGRMTFAGVDGVRFIAESPEPVRGFVFSLAQGEYRLSRGGVSLQPAGTQGCVRAFLNAVRAFDLEELTYANGCWQLAGEGVLLAADDTGASLAMWDEAAGWRAEFG